MSPLDSATLWNKKHPELKCLVVTDSATWYRIIKGWFK